MKMSELNNTEREFLNLFSEADDETKTDIIKLLMLYIAQNEGERQTASEELSSLLQNDCK